MTPDFSSQFNPFTSGVKECALGDWDCPTQTHPQPPPFPLEVKSSAGRCVERFFSMLGSPGKRPACGRASSGTGMRARLPRAGREWAIHSSGPGRQTKGACKAAGICGYQRPGQETSHTTITSTPPYVSKPYKQKDPAAGFCSGWFCTPELASMGKGRKNNMTGLF